MTAGLKPCPWLITEDMPRKRFQPLAGRIYLMELGGVEPLSPSLQTANDSAKLAPPKEKASELRDFISTLCWFFPFESNML